MKQVRIGLARAYDEPQGDEGKRFLVDRMWPRGITKDALQIEAWLRDVAPSTPLRRWFDHKLEHWPEFARRYRAELDGKPEALQPLVEAAESGPVTLVYGARDREHNQAVVLRDYLIDKIKH